MNSKLIAYALDFSSFLIQKIKDKNQIKHIILFGSVAREEADRNSDIDLFLDLVKENKATETETEKITAEFYKSVKFLRYWKLLGIKNELKLVVGELGKWKELKSSIISNGIVLYGRFNPEIKGKPKVLFTWENISPNSRRVLFNKQLFGYKQKGKFYLGLIQKYSGERLGKGSLLVDWDYSVLFHQLFKRHKITVRIKKILEL